MSCCARGGSWFKTCGDGQQSDHTWGEGIRACETSSSFSAQQQEPSRHEKLDPVFRQVNDAHTADSIPYGGLSKIPFFTSLLVISVYTF